MANAATALAQNQSAGPIPEPETAGLITRITEIGIGGAAIAGLLYGAYLVRRRLDSIREREAMEDARMEVELRLLEKQATGAPGANTVSGQSAGQVPVDAILLPQGRQDDQFGFDSQQDGPGPAPAEPALEAPFSPVLNQLRASGMLDQMEDWVELHGNPRGACVLRLRGGKRVLLVPYHETEAFALRNLRRYDALIYIGQEGKAVYVQSLENVIADVISGNLR